MEGTYFARIPKDVEYKSLIYTDLHSLQKQRREFPDEFWIERARKKFGVSRRELESKYLSIPEKYLQIASFHGEVGLGSEKHTTLIRCLHLAAYNHDAKLVKYFAQLEMERIREKKRKAEEERKRREKKEGKKEKKNYGGKSRIEEEKERISIDLSFFIECNDLSCIESLGSFLNKGSSYGFRPSVSDEIYSYLIEKCHVTEEIIAFFDLFDYMKKEFKNETEEAESWEPDIILHDVAARMDVEQFTRYLDYLGTMVNHNFQSWTKYYEYYVNDDPEIPEVDLVAAIMFCCPKILEANWEDTDVIQEDFEFAFFTFPDVSPKRMEKFVLALQEYIDRGLADREICARYLKAYQVILGKIPFSPIERGVDREIVTYAIWYDRVDLMNQLTWSTQINRFRFPDVPYTGPTPLEPPGTNYPGGFTAVNADTPFFYSEMLEYYLNPRLFQDYLSTGEYSSVRSAYPLAPNAEMAKAVVEKYKTRLLEILTMRDERRINGRKLGKIAMKPPTFIFEEAKRWYETVRKKIEEEYEEIVEKY